MCQHASWLPRPLHPPFSVPSQAALLPEGCLPPSTGFPGKPGDWHEGWDVGVEEKETEPPCWPLSGHSPALGPWCGNDSAVVGALVPAIPVTPLACLDKVLYSHYPT